MSHKSKSKEVVSNRILGFLVDFTSAALVMGLLFTFPSVDEFYRELSESFSGLLSLFLFTYCLSVLIRFYCSLLFGTTLGLMLAGVKVQGGSVLSKRVKLACVSLVSPLFLPLRVIDVFYKGRAGLLEYLVGIRYKKSSNGAISVIALALFLVLLPGSLMLWDYTFKDKVKFESMVYTPEELSNDSNFDLYKTYRTNIFHLETFTNLGNDRFRLVPNFELIKSGRFVKFDPSIKIYSKDDKNSANLTLFKSTLNLSKLLLSGFNTDVFMKKSYPNLYKDLVGKKKLSKKSTEELKTLLIYAVSLNTKNVYANIKDLGPYAYGHFIVRKNILELLSLRRNITFDIVKFGNAEFIRVREKNKSLFMPLTNIEIPIYQLSWSGKFNVSEFERTFFSASKWNFSKVTKESFPRSKSQMNPLFILDYFKNKKIDRELRYSLEDYVSEYYFSLARESVKNQDDILKNELYGVLERLGEFIELQNKKSPIYSENFKAAFHNMLKALAKGDRKYFNI